MSIQRRRYGTGLAVIVMLCAVAAQAAAPQMSGFLLNYPLMKPVQGEAGAWAWDSPEANLAAYDRVMFDPVEIWLAADSEYKGIAPDQMKVLSDSLISMITEELEPDFPVVTQPGPGVLRIRLALTNVKLKKKRRVVSYLPIGLAVSGVRRLSGRMNNVQLQATSLEAEMLDSVSGRRIAVRIDNAPGGRPMDAGSTESMSWDALEDTLQFYARRLRTRLEKPQQ